MRSVAQRRPPPLPLAGHRPNPRPPRSKNLPKSQRRVRHHVSSQVSSPMEGAAWLPLDHGQPNGASLLALTEVSATRCSEMLHSWAVCIDPRESAELHSRRTPNAESKCRGRIHQNVCCASGKRLNSPTPVKQHSAGRVAPPIPPPISGARQRAASLGIPRVTRGTVTHCLCAAAASAPPRRPPRPGAAAAAFVTRTASRTGGQTGVPLGDRPNGSDSASPSRSRTGRRTGEAPVRGNRCKALTGLDAII